MDRLAWAVIAAGLVISGVKLHAQTGSTPLSVGLLAGAGLAFLVSLTRR